MFMQPGSTPMIIEHTTALSSIERRSGGSASFCHLLMSTEHFVTSRSIVPKVTGNLLIALQTRTSPWFPSEDHSILGNFNRRIGHRVLSCQHPRPTSLQLLLVPSRKGGEHNYVVPLLNQCLVWDSKLENYAQIGELDGNKKQTEPLDLPDRAPDSANTAIISSKTGTKQ